MKTITSIIFNRNLPDLVDKLYDYLIKYKSFFDFCTEHKDLKYKYLEI